MITSVVVVDPWVKVVVLVAVETDVTVEYCVEVIVTVAVVTVVRIEVLVTVEVLVTGGGVEVVVLVTTDVTVEVVVEVDVTVVVGSAGSTTMPTSAKPEVLNVAGKFVGDETPPVEYSDPDSTPLAPESKVNPLPAVRPCGVPPV